MLYMRLFLTFCQTKYKIRGISGRCVLKVPKLPKYSFTVKQKLQKFLWIESVRLAWKKQKTRSSAWNPSFNPQSSLMMVSGVVWWYISLCVCLSQAQSETHSIQVTYQLFSCRSHLLSLQRGSTIQVQCSVFSQGTMTTTPFWTAWEVMMVYSLWEETVTDFLLWETQNWKL